MDELMESLYPYGEDDYGLDEEIYPEDLVPPAVEEALAMGLISPEDLFDDEYDNYNLY